MKIVFFIICWFNVSVILAQNQSQQNTSIETNFFYGKLIEHDKKIKKSIQGNPYGFTVSINTENNKNSRFNKLFNSPIKGFTFLYENFNSTVLGETYAGYRHYTYKLNSSKNSQFHLTTSFGLAYNTKPYHKINNNQNFAIGSRLLTSAILKFSYFKLLNKEKIGIHTGLSLIHFSNFGFKNPNLGINTVALNFGINYYLTKNKIIPKTPSSLQESTKQFIKYNLVIRGGYNESIKINSGLKPFYTLSFYGSKQLNNYSTFTSGIDYSHATFLKKYIESINIEKELNHNKNEFDRIGIFIGHELAQNNFSFISQIGYTIYYPFPYISRIYERFGFNYKLSKHIFSEISMKVNLFRAEALEIGIGYRF